MVGCGVRAGLLDSEPSAARSQVFLLCLILTSVSAALSSSDKPDQCQSIFSKYQHCRIHPAGVHGLDCFAEKFIENIKCVWKPGRHPAKKTYTLITRQPNNKNTCIEHSNFTEESKLKIYTSKNMTAEIFENADSTNCTKAVFQGFANSWKRCSPPKNASFHRHTGKLDVNVSWPHNENNNYSLRYKTTGSPLWNESLVECQNGKRCTVENLNSSLVYNVQIQCVISKKCQQCPWSQTYTVPAELTSQPEIIIIKDEDIVGKKGERLVLLKWTISAKEMYDKFSVTIHKASEEASCAPVDTTKPELSLVLSHSAFNVSITAVNNVSTSPALNTTIPWRDVSGTRDERLDVTVRSNKWFTLHWKDNLSKTYMCFCVEWRRKGQRVMYQSFFENTEKYRNITISKGLLEPHARYTVTLHTRPNKDTCNMKCANGGESTYSSTEFYYTEGTPVRGPMNISSYNETTNSVELEWSSIVEEDIRGFLLGYTIYYKQKHVTGPWTNITVDPESNHFKLEDLKSGTEYEVQISGFTKAGEGERSSDSFTTNQTEGQNDTGSDNGLGLSIIITVFSLVLIVLIFGPTIIKRTKVVVWPSIPNPGNSNAMQKIEGTCELELLESIHTLKVKEWDTHSLQIVERETVIPATSLPRLHVSEDEDEDETVKWLQRDTGDEGTQSDPTADEEPNAPQPGFQSSPFPYLSEYTTMEMFNQVMPQCVPEITDIREAERSESDPELTVVKPGLDYIRQFSSSPTLDSELSTLL